MFNQCKMWLLRDYFYYWTSTEFLFFFFFFNLWFTWSQVKICAASKCMVQFLFQSACIPQRGVVGGDRFSCLFFCFHQTAVVVSRDSQLCWLPALESGPTAPLWSSADSRQPKDNCYASGWAGLVVWGFFSIKNFITAFQLKDLDLFLLIIFSPPSPTNYLCFLIAPLLTHCRKTNIAVEHNPAHIPVEARWVDNCERRVGYARGRESLRISLLTYPRMP